VAGWLAGWVHMQGLSLKVWYCVAFAKPNSQSRTALAVWVGDVSE